MLLFVELQLTTVHYRFRMAHVCDSELPYSVSRVQLCQYQYAQILSYGLLKQ